MRLLNVHTFELEDDFPDHDLRDARAHIWNSTASDSTDMPEYAILSHRWMGDEASRQRFETIPKSHLSNFSHVYCSPLVTKARSEHGKRSPTLLEDECQSVDVDPKVIYKFAGACFRARETKCENAASLKYVWIDSICIDKTNPSELGTAINSMFRYYQKARVCFVYIFDVSREGSVARPIREQFIHSSWWQRGWTLQELLASREVRFFDRNWEYLGSKTELVDDIATASGIGTKYLLGDFRGANNAQKMSWLSQRSTTRIEDMAYCVLGVFDVYLEPRYGQGEVEFLRLQAAILKKGCKYGPFDESLFAWKSPYIESSGLLAPAPSCFTGAENIIFDRRLAKYRGLFAGSKLEASTGQGIEVDDEFHITLAVPWSNLIPDYLVALFTGPLSFLFVCILDGYNSEKTSRRVQLNCWTQGKDGEVAAKQIEMKRRADGGWQRISCDTLLDSSSLRLYPSKGTATVGKTKLKIPSNVTHRSM